MTIGKENEYESSQHQARPKAAETGPVTTQEAEEEQMTYRRKSLRD
jgi:hypothetical protein